MPEVRMPHVSLGDEDVLVVRWHKTVGDVVVRGEPLVEVETDKASMDVEAPFDGTLAAQHCTPGDTVTPGAVIGYVSVSEETPDAGSAPRARQPAADDREAAGEHAPAAAAARTPLVQHGELAGIPLRATGQVSRSDSLGAVASSVWAGGYADTRLSRRRRAIARRLTEAAHIPQFAITRRISLVSAQNALEAARATGEPATLTDVLVRAVARAGCDAPRVNAWLLGDTLRTFEHVGLAIAVETDDGVVAPVIRDADVLDLAAIIRARAELVERARSGNLRVGDIADATMTLTNVGPVGGDQLFPVLTPPQVTVIGVGREEGEGATFTFTGDHRVLDGADGARYLTRLAEVLDVNEFG
jgi:pyruvate dehydrogenase E2 component (dihydrolipoamide acetyltransferase)